MRPVDGSGRAAEQSYGPAGFFTFFLGFFLIIGLDAWCIKFLLQVQVLLIRSIGETKMGLNLAELPRPICGFGSIGGGVYGSQQ